MERQVVDKTALPEQYWTLNNNPEIYMVRAVDYFQDYDIANMSQDKQDKELFAV